MNKKDYIETIDSKNETVAFIRAANSYASVAAMKESLHKVDMAYKELKKIKKAKNAPVKS
jgi:hypothetical protein